MKTGDTFDFVIGGTSYSAKIESIKNKKENTKIDWSKMPKDTLVEVRSENDKLIRYFSHLECNTALAGETGIKYATFTDGRTSITYPTQPRQSIHAYWKNIKLIDNPWRAWFGGKMPCCGNVSVNVVYRNGTAGSSIKARQLNWEHDSVPDEDIIAYQMLAEEAENE